MLMSGGISRCGRVRKKSSKLLDFQSPDELEKKPKRYGKITGRRGRPRKLALNLDLELVGDTGSGGTDGRSSVDALAELADLGSAEDLALDVKLLEQETGVNSDVTHGMVSNQALLENLLNTAPDSEDELDNLVADLVEGVEAESLQQHKNSESKVRLSLYMTEKSNKRKMLRDGKVITGKMERKDKGKTRYTAYSLWAREFRKTSKFSKNQDLDFSNAARRLGELWANVSNKEKSAWRRKAKLQATKAKARDKGMQQHQEAATPPPTSSKSSIAAAHAYNTAFLNRATTSRTKKLAAAAAAAEQTKALASVNNNNDSSSNNNNNDDDDDGQSLPTTVNKRRRTTTQKSSGGNNAPQSQESVPVPAVIETSAVQLEGPAIMAIDAAAHLKLLGDSLTIIGKRLKEHDGQIAVSGSLSVLLDSLLCSMGPLLCLTTHIPGLEHKQQLQDNLAATLDNIAYVMPGL